MNAGAMGSRMVPACGISGRRWLGIGALALSPSAVGDGNVPAVARPESQHQRRVEAHQQRPPLRGWVTVAIPALSCRTSGPIPGMALLGLPECPHVPEVSWHRAVSCS